MNKGKSWFILELYTPKQELKPPKESTTFVKVNINEMNKSNLIISNTSNTNVNINNYNNSVKLLSDNTKFNINIRTDTKQHINMSVKENVTEK